MASLIIAFGVLPPFRVDENGKLVPRGEGHVWSILIPAIMLGAFVVAWAVFGVLAMMGRI